jgi:hypothetical protein
MAGLPLMRPEVSIATKLMIEPTDRSIPPVRIVNV